MAEAALVAGVLPAPSKYSPFVTPAAARNRQEYVINQMVENSFLSRDEANAALAEKLKFYTDRPNYNLAYTPLFHRARAADPGREIRAGPLVQRRPESLHHGEHRSLRGGG